MQIQRRSLLKGAVACLAYGSGLARPEAATAQIWPQRPVKFITSLGPGSGTDVSARLIADRLTARWSQPVVVENHAGGNAVVAINAFIGAHDDHTLLYTPTSSITAHPYQYDKLPYDARELSPVARIVNTIIGVAVNPHLGVRTLADLIERVRGEPGKLNYSTGTGMTDLIYDAYFKTAGLIIKRVPYRGVVAPMMDLAEGRIDAYIAGLSIMRPHVQAGRAKLVAITNSARASMQSDVPTVTEAGFPELTFDGLIGVFGKRDMAAAARARVASDIRSVVAEPAVAARLTAMAMIINPGDGAGFAAALQAQSAKLAASAKLLDIKPHS